MSVCNPLTVWNTIHVVACERIIHLIFWMPFIQPDVEEVLHLYQTAKGQQPQDGVKVYFEYGQPGQRV